MLQDATVVRECHWDEYQRWADVAAYLKPLLVPLVAGWGFYLTWTAYDLMARRFGWDRRVGPGDRRRSP
jgi:hypothetical protein